MIADDIRNFNQQFSWEPEIKNHQGSALRREDYRDSTLILLGMGGSHLGADLLNAYDPKIGLTVHSSYGLPANVSVGHLVIASSYSGNTEEVIDGLNESLARGLEAVVITSGGRLINLAKEKSLPFIQLPPGLQPRMSVGFQFKALAKLLGRQDILEKASRLADQLNPAEFEERGIMLGEKIADKIPVIFSSQANWALAYNWKIKFNETGKIPAFYNVFPEMSHNEINGLSNKFIYLVLIDREDYSRIRKGMEVLIKILKTRNLAVEAIELAGKERIYRIFSFLLLADWTAYRVAEQTGADPEAVPLVEEFKKLIK